MNKVLASILATFMILMLVACGKDKGVESKSQPQPWWKQDVCSGSSPYHTFARWPGQPATVQFYVSTSFPKEWRSLIVEAARTWGTVGADLSVQYWSCPIEGDVKYDQKNVVCYGPDDESALGKAYCWYDNGRMFEADIRVNSLHPLSNGGSESTYDVLSVLTHEFGHFFGLDHVNDRTHTMCGEGLMKDCTIYRTLCSGDKAGLNYLY